MIQLRILATFAFISAFTTSAPAEAQNVNPQPAAEVGVLVEYIELDSSTAGKFVSHHEGDGTALRLQLQELVDAGSAKILNTVYLHARGAVRQKVESISEFIYPTEYDPPYAPKTVIGNIAPDADLIIPSSPTAFDVRYLGSDLELEASVRPGTDLISLNFSSDLVDHVGDIDYGNGDVLASQPVFDVLRSRTKFCTTSGEFTLTAMHSPRATDEKIAREPSRRVLVMLRATILEPGPPPIEEKAPDVEPYDPDDPFSTDPEAPYNPIQIGTFLEYIKVKTATATRLTREHAADDDASEFRQQLEKMITKGQAELIDSSYIVSVAGQRAKTESIHEFIYPTEYNPPSFGEFPELQRVQDPTTGLSILSSPPSAFDVRNVGGTFELEPSIDTDGTVSLNLAPEIVRFIDFLHYGEEQIHSLQPVFFNIGAQTNLHVQSNGSSLVSMQMPHDDSATGADSARLDPDHRILVFVKANVFKITPKHDEK